jgi:glycosyltransferase involved in cell wall biosynthesis
VTIACLVTTFNRPRALARSLPQIAALGAPVLVVDDGSHSTNDLENSKVCYECGAKYLWIPENRGLAAALNIGLSYWLADKAVEGISYFQDDVDVHPKTLEILSRLHKLSPILTGHDAAAHKSHAGGAADGIAIKFKHTSAGVHLHCSAEFWRGVLPVPTFMLGAPKRNGKPGRGVGSDVDWWIVRDSPRSAQRLGRQIVCVPNLVRTFFWKAEDSSWNNSQPTGEEPPLTNQWTN